MDAKMVQISWNSWQVRLLLFFYDDDLPDMRCGLWFRCLCWIGTAAVFPLLAAELILTLLGVDVDRLYGTLPMWMRLALGAYAVSMVAFIILRATRQFIPSHERRWPFCRRVEYI